MFFLNFLQASSVLVGVVLSCFCFTINLYFYKFRMLPIIESVPRAFGHSAPLRAVLRTEVSTVLFFCKGRWLQANALRAVHQTLASVLRGGQRLSMEGGLYCSRSRSNFVQNSIFNNAFKLKS